MTWYDVVTTRSLEQGDLLPAVSVLLPILAVESGGSDLTAEVVTLDAIVLTQTCDIEQRKVSDLLVGAVIDWDEMVDAETLRGNQTIKSKAMRQKLIEGSLPSMSLLHRNDDPPLNWSVVNFKQLFSIPLQSIESNSVLMDQPRLRLRSPYKEHLAQALARFFMRVGLPHTAEQFKEYTGRAS